MTREAAAVESLVKVYNPHVAELAVRAIDSISFRIASGESVAICGPSGCGKSSLLHVLGCLDRPTSGAVRIGGEDVSALGDDALARVRNRQIGFVFQSFNLLPRMNAVENVELPLTYRNDPRHTRERAEQALERVGLADRALHRPNELSGGQRQRVAIARALVTEPAILLCDEPTGALDSRTGRQVLDLLAQLNGEGVTLIMVTHDLAVARAQARAIRMSDGRIAADGPSGSVVDAIAEELASEARDAAP